MNFRNILFISNKESGISDTVFDKKFTPNFTTKTCEVGLGLAMVKSIVESCGGKIWFETEENSGTTFFVELPSY